MTAARPYPLMLVLFVALFLYWVVQDPVGAAAMLRQVLDWIVQFLQLVAERLVQFLGALV